MPAPSTRFLTNDPLTRKRWAKDLFKVILPAVEYNSLVGSGSDSVVQMRKELGKGEGDEITFGLRLPLVGEGIVGDNTVESNEEKLRFRNFKCTIDELNHAVDTGGKMEEQRVPFNLMQEGKDALQDWWAAKISDLIINTLVGNTAYVIAGEAFANPISAPSTNKKLLINSRANEASIVSTDTMDLQFLDAMKQLAEVPKSGTYKVRPIVIGGKNYYRVYMHNYVFDALRRNTNVGEWGDMLRAANKLAVPQVEIEYNGMLISKSERIPNVDPDSTDARAGVYRTILCGAQAAVLAWGGAGESKGSTMSFVPYTRDAHRYVMIRGGGILGCRKTIIEGEDFGLITGSTWAAPTAA